MQLGIQRGYMRAGVDEDGQLEIDQLEIAIAPITIDGMFDRPVQLQDVILRLAEPVRSEAAWTSEDDATATLEMALDLGWAIAFDGGHVYRIPTQHLPPGSVEVVLSGSGAFSTTSDTFSQPATISSSAPVSTSGSGAATT